MRILKYSIVGFFSLALVVMTTPNAYAIFSPPIANQMAVMKQHIFEARQLNGTGSIRHGVTKVFDDKTVEKLIEDDRERRRTRTVPGLPAQYQEFRQKFKADIAKEELANYGSSFALLFNRMKVGDKWVWITSCLRNDIMKLEQFRDAIMAEALRSALLRNKEHAAILWNDYETIRNILFLLKTKYGTEPRLFFEGGQPNYYAGDACPLGGFWGEYSRAIEDLERSWGVFKTLGTGGNVQWGSIWEMAEARAKIRAKEWIRANQISLTLGGEQGASPTSLADLFKREGFGGIGNRLQGEWNIVKGMFGPLIPIFDPNLYITAAQAIAVGLGANEEILDDNVCAYYEAGQNKWRGCTATELEQFEEETCRNCRNKLDMGRTALSVANDLQKQLEERTAFLGQAETTLQFNLTFNSIAEAETVDIEGRLFEINTEIKRGLEAFGDKAGKALPTVCKEFRTILLKHCPNKGGDIPACR